MMADGAGFRPLTRTGRPADIIAAVTCDLGNGTPSVYLPIRIGRNDRGGRRAAGTA